VADIFLVSRKSFLTDFLLPIKKFNNNPDDYIPFEWDGENLVTLLPFENKVFMLSEHKVVKTKFDKEVGESFYIKKPARLCEIFKMLVDDIVALKTFPDRLTHTSKNSKFVYRLIDPIIGKNSMISSLNVKRAKSMETIPYLKFDKDMVTKIRKFNSSFNDPLTILSFLNIEKEVWIKFALGNEEAQFNTHLKADEEFEEFRMGSTVLNYLENLPVELMLETNKQIMTWNVNKTETKITYIVTRKNHE